MNQVNEILDTKEATCREINLFEMMTLLKSEPNKFMSWGAFGRTFGYGTQTSPKPFVNYIRMRVSGNHHKGYVYIFLNGMDLFDVYLTTLQNKIKIRTDEMGIYFDQLVEWIDDRVERIPEYHD
jgi:hypothetical protein